MFLRKKNRLCWDCSLYQKCSVDLKYSQNALADTAGEAHDAHLDPIVGWEGGHPLPNPTPLGTFGASILALAALSFCGP